MTQEDIIAIFPLPNVVFFPKTDLPLHIFEPRYCEMVKETIQNKQLIGMFLLQPGWQEDYYGNPPVFPIGCAGEIVHVEHLPDEKYNIVLRGLYRAQAIETVQEYPYRKARVQVLPELSSSEKNQSDAIRVDLLSDFRKLATMANDTEALPLKEGMDFTETVHFVASALQFDVEMKMELLCENDIYLRAQRVQELLKNQLSLFEWTKRFSHLKPSDPNLN